MIRIFPKEPITWSTHCNDVVNVCIVYGGRQPTPTGTDTWHTKVFDTILLPLISIASTCCTRPSVWCPLRGWCWVQRALVTTIQGSTTHTAGAWWSAWH